MVKWSPDLTVERHVPPVADVPLETCAGGQLDPNSGLCWEQRTTSIPYWNWDATHFCEGDWRLPTVCELRTLLDGCSSTEPGGECRIDSALRVADVAGTCDGCRASQPAQTCFWKPSVFGKCGRYFADGGGFQSFAVDFTTGAVMPYDLASDVYLRCVKGAGE
jgi:hypothetical protein